MAAARSVRWLWLTLAVLAADRATKYAIERLTDEGFRRPLVPNFVDLVHSVNAGIAFGLLSQSASKWIALLLVLSSVVVISLLAWLLFAGHAGPLESQAGIALIAGGAGRKPPGSVAARRRNRLPGIASRQFSLARLQSGRFGHHHRSGFNCL